ncbi:5'/3'-nucleotidase SurE [Crenobacter cavernae]|uniref:5'-nucleotidase n=1 Tax=Crenobacter cavernae TaxID=2290923 RepID=A0A345Y4X8_9NEIS|nr:5'/3'-nucleotidase SurE [Crenobacter cavernae]AXK38980.1 hypothetical protein DWG20_05765 [Crenobacter cavernae]
MNARHALLCLPLLAALGQPAHALNILLCNDDGFTAANLRALQSRLKTAGHNVIVSSPVDNQSGKGGSMDFLKAVPAVNSAERAVAKGTLTDGATGVGADDGSYDGLALVPAGNAVPAKLRLVAGNGSRIVDVYAF